MASPAIIPENMPVGYGFRPTDEELVGHYLKRKLLGDDSLGQIIAEVDIYRVEPWALPAQSKVESDDPEWFFFCPRGLKYSNSNRYNRATKAGYWKATGRDRNVKTRRTNNVIGTKKTLVFYRGRVPNGVKTNWVIHEYQAVTFPVSRRTFVLCRLMKKTEKNEEEGNDALITNEGETSSHVVSDYENQATANTSPDVNLESIFQATLQPEEYDFPSILQSPTVLGQEPSSQYFPFPNAHLSENHSMNFLFETTEEEDNADEFLNSIFADEDVSLSEGTRHAFFNDFTPIESLGTDGELFPAQYGNILDTTSTRYNEHAGSREFQVMKMVQSSHGAVQAGTPPLSFKHEVNQEKNDSIFHEDFQGVHNFSGDSTADKPLSICVIRRVSSRSPSPPRRCKTKYHSRSDNLVSQRAASKRSLAHRKVSSKAASQHEVQKETNILESNKDQRKAQGTSSRKNMETTSDGANKRGSFIYLETPSMSQNLSPRSVYLVNVVIGFSLLIVTIWDAISSGKCY